MKVEVELPEKKKRKTAKSSSSPQPPALSFFSLPNEIIENCLARLPRSYHRKLSMVSKSFRSVLSSTELYEARSHLGNTEQVLYVCRYNLDSNCRDSFQWFTLWISPNQAQKKIGQLLALIPSSNSATTNFATTANPTVVGSEIYIIGGYRDPSSSVRVLDCRSHTWRDAPSMNVARINPKSCFYDGKIYVMGGCSILEQGSPFAEVFDTKTQSWECLPDPGSEIRRRFVYGIVEIEGKIYFGRHYKRYAYDTKQGKWEGPVNTSETFGRTECVMDNVLYTFKKHGRQYNFWWRDVNGGDSKEVKGLYSFGNRYKRHGGSDRTLNKVAICGGKLYLMWERYKKKNNPNNMMEIWMAEISVEKCDGEVWGNVEWVNVVQTVLNSCQILHCLTVSV